jgi:hypothetical protein
MKKREILKDATALVFREWQYPYRLAPACERERESSWGIRMKRAQVVDVDGFPHLTPFFFRSGGCWNKVNDRLRLKPFLKTICLGRCVCSLRLMATETPCSQPSRHARKEKSKEGRGNQRAFPLRVKAGNICVWVNSLCVSSLWKKTWYLCTHNGIRGIDKRGRNRLLFSEAPYDFHAGEGWCDGRIVIRSLDYLFFLVQLCVYLFGKPDGSTESWVECVKSK